MAKDLLVVQVEQMKQPLEMLEVEVALAVLAEVAVPVMLLVVLVVLGYLPASQELLSQEVVVVPVVKQQVPLEGQVAVEMPEVLVHPILVVVEAERYQV